MYILGGHVFATADAGLAAELTLAPTLVIEGASMEAAVVLRGTALATVTAGTGVWS